MKRLLAMFLSIAACESPDKAVDPVWGKQTCSSCGMIVGDKHTAAEIVTKGGDRLFFDDPGCMVVWMSAHAGQHSRAWVKDANDGAWLDVTSAKWTPGATTPMDYGWTANASSGESFETMRAAVANKRSAR